MRITFQLRFHTRFGQDLFLVGDHPLLGSGDFAHARPLSYLDDQRWHATLVLPDDALPDVDIAYNYVLREPDSTLIYDWGNDRTLNLATFAGEQVLVVDAWNHAGFHANTFNTEPFRRVLLPREAVHPEQPLPANPTHVFNVQAPLLARNQTVCLLGSGPTLREWNVSNPLLLSRPGGQSAYSVGVELAGATFPLAYKYGVYDLEQRRFVRYEDGDNRDLEDSVAPAKRTIINDGFVRLPTASWKGAGVAIPVFSLRSEKSFGVGEFADLRLLTDWCARVGVKMIQILPINDTAATKTWVDSYPYAAISAFALHPQYLRLEHVVTPDTRGLLEDCEPLRQDLNALPAVDYERVLEAKLALLRQIFPAQRDATFAREDYLDFIARNGHWLTPYAVFSHLRDRFGTPDYTRWPQFSRCTVEEMAALAARGSRARADIEFHYFVQFHLHQQLRAASEYAHARGVILKGDLAIGVGRFGADTWEQPDLYRLDFQAGAPPDAFAVKGQNWGFPTYDWPRMKATGFAWWKQRFGQMSSYFDAFRIDHILGFFRIWSVPMHAVEGILGYFVPALPVRGAEFIARDIEFDRDRFVKPWITDDVLDRVFGAEADFVREHFLHRDRFSRYELRAEFGTQRQVQAHFAALAASDQNERLRQGLYELISNVLLLEAPSAAPGEFHFRFAIDSTSSFRDLDPQTQARLQELYIDYFYRRQEDFWMREGLEKLPALKRVTNMLVCGEDLGLVPACVPEVMRRLGLLSLEIQRMPKDPNQEFFRPASAPYLSVVTPGTHDMSTLRGWWLEDRAVTQRFFNRELGQPGPAPAECEPWINRAIVRQHLDSPAMWCVVQLQDYLGMDPELRRQDTAEERINVPANPRNYWRYRMHLNLEQLLAAETFNSGLAGMIRAAGR